MKHRLTSRSREAAVLLWVCLLLFAARVLGQFEAFTLAPAWLPDMDAWYSGLLPYYLLLPAQVVLLMIMAVVAWNPRVAGALRILAGVYFLVMAVRLAVNLNGHGADFWRAGAIPVAFHWVLALFLLVSARPGLSGERVIHAEEVDELPDGDVPALVQEAPLFSTCPPNYFRPGN